MKKIIRQTLLLTLCLTFIFSLAACSKGEYIIMNNSSMEPTIPAESRVYYEPVDCATLQVDDLIVCVVSENTTSVRRIIEVVPDENDPTVIRFVTKGDNNESADLSLLHHKNVLGKVTDIKKGRF